MTLLSHSHLAVALGSEAGGCPAATHFSLLRCMDWAHTQQVFEDIGNTSSAPLAQGEGHAMARPCLYWVSLSWPSAFGIRTAPSWLGRAAQMEAGSGPQLFERSEFCGPPPESSSAGCPQRSVGTQTAGRLFFGYFLLAKQKKVTSRRATPGQLPIEPLPKPRTTNKPRLSAGAPA